MIIAPLMRDSRMVEPHNLRTDEVPVYTRPEDEDLNFIEVNPQLIS